MSRGYYKNRPMANAGPRSNRRYKREKKFRGKPPEGSVTVLTLDPLRCSIKDNREIVRGEYVYFITTSNSQRVKVGISNDPFKRLRALQTSNSEDLRIALLISCGRDFGKAGVEKAVHHSLGRSKVRGEWFDAASPAVSQFINYPNQLPWKVIEGMVRLGVRASFRENPQPKYVRPLIEEKKLESVKTQFLAYLSHIL